MSLQVTPCNLPHFVIHSIYCLNFHLLSDNMDAEVAMLTAEWEMGLPISSRNTESLPSTSPTVPVPASSSRTHVTTVPRRLLPPRVPHRSPLHTAPGANGPPAPRAASSKPRWTPVVWNGPRSASAMSGARPPVVRRSYPVGDNSSSRAALQGGDPPVLFGSRATIRRREARQALLSRVRASLRGRQGGWARRSGAPVPRPPRVPRTPAYYSQWGEFSSSCVVRHGTRRPPFPWAPWTSSSFHCCSGQAAPGIC